MGSRQLYSLSYPALPPLTTDRVKAKGELEREGFEKALSRESWEGGGKRGQREIREGKGRFVIQDGCKFYKCFWLQMSYKSLSTGTRKLRPIQSKSATCRNSKKILVFKAKRVKISFSTLLLKSVLLGSKLTEKVSNSICLQFLWKAGSILDACSDLASKTGEKEIKAHHILTPNNL